MTKMILVGVGAIVIVALGFWIKSTSADHPVVALSVVPKPSISPLELHQKAKQTDIPVQYMRGDSYY